MSAARWSPDRATAWLLDRGMFGMQPGLDRIRRLLAQLDDPQAGLRTIHVVGTNGKSSTARFAAALLAEQGFPTGAYVSPHLVGFEERVLLPGAKGLEDASADGFASAIGRVADAADRIERDLADGDRITQFEAVTAAAFLLFRERGIERAAIEAGLGGRHDATNVLDPGVVALTSVGIDHERWLGSTVEAIAGEKLAVVEEGDVLVVAPDLPVEVDRVVEQACHRSGRPVVVAPSDPGDTVVLRAAGSFQRRNFALAAAAVTALDAAPDPAALARVAGAVAVPGRFTRISEDPDVWLDAAHNPQGVAAAMEEIVAVAQGRPVTAVVGLLADKDADGVAAAMLGRVQRVITTSPENPRSMTAAELASVLAGAGLDRVEACEDPRVALDLARAAAARDGIVVALGSVHLAGDLSSLPGQRVVTAL